MKRLEQAIGADSIDHTLPVTRHGERGSDLPVNTDSHDAVASLAASRTAFREPLDLLELRMSSFTELISDFVSDFVLLVKLENRLGHGDSGTVSMSLSASLLRKPTLRHEC